MKKYLLFLRDDIIRRIGYLPWHIVIRYMWMWGTSIFFLHKANLCYAKRKHRFITTYLDKHYGGLVPTCEMNQTIQDISNLNIWVFWYQGESSMPELIRMCYKSICKNANGRKVVLLTKDNIDDYVQMPSYIIEKVNKGYISFTHLSDLIRVSLLYKYGGTWMDATLLVTAPIDNSKMNGVFGTVKVHPLSEGTISDYRWTSFYMFCFPGSLAMKCFRDVMFSFLGKNKGMLDYFFIDYTFELLYQKNPSFKRIVDDNPYTNQHIFSCRLNETYHGQFDNEWADTHLFKLNRRTVIDKGMTDSVYHHAAEMYLNS